MTNPKVNLNKNLWVRIEDVKATLEARLPMKIDAVTCVCRAANVAMAVFMAPTSKPCPTCGSLILLQCVSCQSFMCAGCLEARTKKFRDEHEVDTVSDHLLQRDTAKN